MTLCQRLVGRDEDRASLVGARDELEEEIRPEPIVGQVGSSLL